MNGASFYKSMKKSLGDKENLLVKIILMKLLKYENFEENENSIIVNNEFFGYTKITIEQPKIENGEVLRNNKGYPNPIQN